MPLPLTIVLVDKTGVLKDLTVKDYKEDELFKKCGFKKADGFSQQAEWSVKLNGQKYYIIMFGKDDGKANMENKYDFPPPVDSKLFFGCCVLVGQLQDEGGKKALINLTTELWTKLYEKLFGGFEDLTTMNDDDDVLDSVPKSKKTKATGYLKDGFVVDDSNDESNDESNDDNKVCDNNNVDDDTMLLEDIGSELSEDSYDYN